MSSSKIILLAEVPIQPEYLDEIKALCTATLIPTLAEPGCEAFYQTTKLNDPATLVFFEIFASQEAIDRHMDALYTKAFFAGIQGKLAGPPVTTRLQAL